MQISQLQVANDSIQDRLVLRIATQSNEEIRVYITRRFLRELWPYLATMLSGHLASQPSFPNAGHAGSENPTTFDQPFREKNPIFPLGSNPLLASEATLESAGEGQARLILREGRERNCNLNLNAELLQALCAMLRAASEQANWNIALDYKVTRSPMMSNTTAGKRLLH
ncbi:MAG: hypothetical protein PHV02_13630 [Rhodocyclaceae bacterium]|nr:hypothetical protein [Rhodocyclaceae bacterium]